MKKISIRRIASGLARLIVYCVAGAAAGLAIWYFVTRSVELWRYDPGWVSTGFLVVLMLAGYAVPEIIERLQGWFSPAPDQASRDGWATSFRLLVTAILIPVSVFLVANHVTWLSTVFTPPQSDEYRLVTQVADTVIASESSTTRVAGIETLGSIASQDSLAMLTKIVDQNPAILNDRSAYAALSKAIASYGPQAKAWLQSTFQAHAQPAGAGAGAGLEAGVYEQYFQPSFLDLQAEIKRAVADPALQNDLLLKLAVDESQLKSDLADIEAQQPALESGDRTLDFVLDTLANSKLTDDPNIYQLAKQVAGDAAYGVASRRRAILLVAQFGSQKDFDFLLPYLQDSDESLRATALVAMKNLYQKSNPAQASSATK
jgi:hypothetical protein